MHSAGGRDGQLRIFYLVLLRPRYCVLSALILYQIIFPIHTRIISCPRFFFRYDTDSWTGSLFLTLYLWLWQEWSWVPRLGQEWRQAVSLCVWRGAIIQRWLERPVRTFPRSNCQAFKCENLQLTSVQLAWTVLHSSKSDGPHYRLGCGRLFV